MHVGAGIPNIQRIHTDQQQEQDRAAVTVEPGVCGQAEQHWQLPQVHGHQVGPPPLTPPSVCLSHVSDKDGSGGASSTSSIGSGSSGSISSSNSGSISSGSISSNGSSSNGSSSSSSSSCSSDQQTVNEGCAASQQQHKHKRAL